MRYFCRISYNGTKFNGWQKQHNSKNTIQTIIESTLSKLLGKETFIHGCGRTDTGVHAKNYWFHFDCGVQLDTKHILYKCNKMVPAEISFHELKIVGEDLHARFHAISRSYVYRLKNYKDPFDGYHLYYPYLKKEDISVLNQISELIMTSEDFTRFHKIHSSNKTNICKIFDCKWMYKEEEETFEFYIKANRFLRGMIRLLVGACLLYLRKKLTFEEINLALKKSKELPQILSVTAEGLVLCDIEYENF
jgi:tRNA pseudouridine38-40 synthase